MDYFRFGAQWIRYKNRTGHSLLTGNWDTTTTVLQHLDPPIIASKIRIVPHSEQTRTMCLRLELHGCEDGDALIAYSLNREGSGEFRDRIFEDTKAVDTIMGGRKGFGLLTDGIIASNAPHDSAGRPYTNSSWIGWSHNSTFGKIILIFEFERVKNFTDVELFAWGEPIDIVEVEFSQDGNAFSPEDSVQSRYPFDSEAQKPGPYSIRVPLPNRSGKFVRIRLNFQGKWIYLTEVDFNTGEFLNIVDKFSLVVACQKFFRKIRAPKVCDYTFKRLCIQKISEWFVEPFNLKIFILQTFSYPRNLSFLSHPFHRLQKTEREPYNSVKK